MVLNPDKRPFLSIGKGSDDAETFNFNDLAIKNSEEVEILRITLDRNMNFHNYNIKNVCRKANQKLRGLLRISLILIKGRKFYYIGQ